MSADDKILMQKILLMNLLQLSSSGLDVGFSMDMMISTELEKKIMDHRDQMMEGIKYRVSVG